MRYFFEDYALDIDRCELLRGTDPVPVEPQVFDLLLYLIRNRERVVSRDDLLASVWRGRIVSESALSTRINAARSILGDSGEEQRLIKTLPRRGVRFVGAVREEAGIVDARAMQHPPGSSDKPSIAVLPFENLSGDPEQDYSRMELSRTSPRRCHAIAHSLSSPAIRRLLTRARRSTPSRWRMNLASVICSKAACADRTGGCASPAS